MSDPVRGITCPDMRRVIREALANGWVFVGWSGTTHGEIRWPKTGETLRFGSTPSVASWKSMATDIKRTSGVEVWRKGNRRRSRKAADLSGFSLDAARRESRAWHDDWDQHLGQLVSRRESLIAECRSAAESGKRELICGLADKLRQIADIECLLADDFHQHVEPFDPYSLAETDGAA